MSEESIRANREPGDKDCQRAPGDDASISLHVLAAITGYFAVSALLLPWLMPTCPLHALTGLYCPGCGGTRAIQALLHGDPGRALAYNPLLPFMLALGLFLLADQVLLRLKGKRLIPLRHHGKLALAALAVVALFFLARNMDCLTSSFPRFWNTLPGILYPL